MSEFVNILKRVKPLYKAYEYTKQIRNGSRLKTCVKKIGAEHSQNNRIRVGFIVQLPSIWEKQAPLYEELRKRSLFDTYLLVIPGCNSAWDGNMEYGDHNYFLENYPEAIRIVDRKNGYSDLRELHLDYLFYPRPYEHYIPDVFRTHETMAYTRCCYIPYGISGSDVFNAGNISDQFFYNMYFCFMDSEYSKELFIQEHSVNYRKGIQKIEYCGYPALDEYFHMDHTHQNTTLTWTPRWSYDPVKGGSNFFEYKDKFVELVSDSKAKAIFRPHPLMFSELVSKKLISAEDMQAYRNKLTSMGVLIDVDSPVNELLKDTDILITDYSSIVIQFFMTNRPIIYCEKGIPLNPVYQELTDYMYVTHNWNEVSETAKMLISGVDPKKERRKAYIEETYAKYMNAAGRIADEIEKDFLKTRR